MKLLLVGGHGTLGKAVLQELKPRHEILVAGRSAGDIACDITSPDSIRKMYQDVGPLDGVICCAGNVFFGPLDKMSEKEMLLGIHDKLMGQVNLVMIGQHHLNPGGSFTLTSGLLSDDPIPFGASASLVNGALHGFVTGASIELPQGMRLNVVCPGVLTESLKHYGSYFRGYTPVSASEVALAFSKSVEGKQTGKIFRVG